MSKPSALSAQTQQVQLTQEAHSQYQRLSIQTIASQDGYVTA